LDNFEKVEIKVLAALDGKITYSLTPFYFLYGLASIGPSLWNAISSSLHIDLASWSSFSIPLPSENLFLLLRSSHWERNRVVSTVSDAM